MAKEQSYNPALMQKRSFVKTGEPTLVSYSWEEMGTGTGYGTYYGYDSGNSAGTDYGFLSTKVHSSERQVYEAGAGDLVNSWETEENKTPRVLKGTIFVFFNYGAERDSGTNPFYATCKVYHVRGAVETQLGATWQSVNRSGAGGVYVQFRDLAIFKDQEIGYKKGDKIKVTISIIGAQFKRKAIGCDPYDEASVRLDNTLLEMHLPFKIDN